MRPSIAFALILCSQTVLADEWPYVQVNCDPGAKTLRIEERSASSTSDIPKGKGVQSLRDLTELKTIDAPSGRQDIRVKIRDFQSSCTLGDITYKLVVSPWKFSARINGMCGGYAPSAQLSVWRSGQRLVDSLIFAGYCNAPESDFGISELRLIEGTQIARFQLVDKEGAFQKDVEFSRLPQLARGALARHVQ
jgi:hypothetical protein